MVTPCPLVHGDWIAAGRVDCPTRKRYRNSGTRRHRFSLQNVFEIKPIPQRWGARGISPEFRRVLYWMLEHTHLSKTSRDEIARPDESVPNGKETDHSYAVPRKTPQSRLQIRRFAPSLTAIAVLELHQTVPKPTSEKFCCPGRSVLAQPHEETGTQEPRPDNVDAGRVTPTA
jgi:hypothetical protein